MRLKRLCEKKPKSQKCHVDEETHKQYNQGGPGREWLEMALLEALQKVGNTELKGTRGHHKRMVAARLIYACVKCMRA